MKKIYYAVAAVAMTLLAAGCFKTDPKNNDKIPEFAEPSTKDHAMSIQFEGSLLEVDLPMRSAPSDPTSGLEGEKVSLKIPVIHLSEDSRYVLFINEIGDFKKENDYASVWTGPYVFDKNDNSYELEGFAKLEVNENEGKCIVRPVVTKATAQYGDAIPMDAVVNHFVQTTAVSANLNRTWKVASTHISVKGGKNEVNFSKGFTGCDLQEIGKYCKDMKVSISDDDLAGLQGYKVQEIMLEGNNSVIITFDSKDPYYGSYTANGTSFTWSLNESNRFFSAHATGTVGFPRNGQVELVLNSTITGGNETYTGTVTFTLEQGN